eukprot:14060-Chlamydomonas_euryale.AAC.1
MGTGRSPHLPPHTQTPHTVTCTAAREARARVYGRSCTSFVGAPWRPPIPSLFHSPFAPPPHTHKPPITSSFESSHGLTSSGRRDSGEPGNRLPTRGLRPGRNWRRQ